MNSRDTHTHTPLSNTLRNRVEFMPGKRKRQFAQHGGGRRESVESDKDYVREAKRQTERCKNPPLQRPPPL